MKVLPDPNRPLGTEKAFLPYAPFHLRPTLPVTVARVVVDGKDVTAEAVDPHRCRLRPHVTGRWSEMSATVRLPREALDEVAAEAFPAERPPPLGAVGRLACRDTRSRASVWLEDAGDGALEGDFRLRADDVARLCTLDVLAVRSGSAARPVPGRAAHARARLAVSPQWVLEVVEPPTPAAGAFDFASVDFTNPEPEGPFQGQDAPLLRTIPTALSHVVIRPEGPLILINKARPEVMEVLEAKGTVGFNARLRDVVLRQIAGASWRTILTEAWLCCQRAGDDEGWALMSEDHWSTRALDRAASLLDKRNPQRVNDLLDRLDDEAVRPGLVSALSERLSEIGNDPVPQLIEEVRGR